MYSSKRQEMVDQRISEGYSFLKRSSGSWDAGSLELKSRASLGLLMMCMHGLQRVLETWKSSGACVVSWNRLLRVRRVV